MTMFNIEAARIALVAAGFNEAQVESALASALAAAEKTQAEAELAAAKAALEAAQKRAIACGLTVATPQQRSASTSTSRNRTLDELPARERAERLAGRCPCGCNQTAGGSVLGWRPGHDARNGGHHDRVARLAAERQQ